MGGQAAGDFPEAQAWTVEGVHGNMTLVAHGGIFMIHTSDTEEDVVYLDDVFARTAPGRPTELARQHLAKLRDLLTRALGEA
jgi:hypothetical protein